MKAIRSETLKKILLNKKLAINILNKSIDKVCIDGKIYKIEIK